MNPGDFRRAGHGPTLFCAFLYFGMSCMAWMLIGAMGKTLGSAFRLSHAHQGLLVATPILGGAILRIFMGLMTDRIGARRTALIGLVVTMIPLLLGWLWVTRYEQLLLVGLLLGVPGASFAAALPMASRWYPPQFQGLALGIAGAGNSGTALATFLAPRLVESWGWQAVFGLALIPVSITWIFVWLVACDTTTPLVARSLQEYATPLKTRDAWWFCILYSVTFGGFVGLTSFLSIFFHDEYELTPIHAGSVVTVLALAGSLIRPVGGYLSDRFGGIRILLVLYLGLAMVMAGMAFLPELPTATALLFAGMILLGMGNGAVFQLVPQRFPREIGVMTGLVGAAGGIGGFILPNLLGGLKGMTGSFSGAFAVFALAGLTCAVILFAVSPMWERDFVGRGGLASESA